MDDQHAPFVADRARIEVEAAAMHSRARLGRQDESGGQTFLETDSLEGQVALEPGAWNRIALEAGAWKQVLP